MLHYVIDKLFKPSVRYHTINEFCLFSRQNFVYSIVSSLCVYAHAHVSLRLRCDHKIQRKVPNLLIRFQHDRLFIWMEWKLIDSITTLWTFYLNRVAIHWSNSNTIDFLSEWSKNWLIQPQHSGILSECCINSLIQFQHDGLFSEWSKNSLIQTQYHGIFYLNGVNSSIQSQHYVLFTWIEWILIDSITILWTFY